MALEPKAMQASSVKGERWSIAARLACMFASAAVVIFVLMGAALIHVLERELDQYQMQQLQGRMEDLRYMLVHSRSPQLAEHVKAKMLDLQAADGRNRYWLWSEDAAYSLGGSAQWVAQQLSSPALNGPLPTLLHLTMPGEAKAVAVLGANLAANDVRPAVQLMVGTDATGLVNTLHRFRAAVLGLTLLAALLVAALGYWIAGLGLRPLQQLSSETQRIGRKQAGENTARQGHERLQLPVLPKELLNLGISINAALDRLSATYLQLETFNADVAHELRTPVTNLIGQTQVALSRERSAPELREILQSNLEELERLRGIVADMLFLARAEQGARAHDAVQVSLAEEMGKIVEFFEMLLDDGGLQVHLSGDAHAMVQRPLLRRAMSNLLQNAIQHGVGNAPIEVRIESGQPPKGAEPGMAELIITNASQVIAPDQLVHLFDRFYRLDGARANSGENHGLGLAIVKAIAVMHGGKVWARQSEAGLSVGLQLPSMSQHDPEKERAQT